MLTGSEDFEPVLVSGELGIPHRADDDALNTLRLFFELLNRQYKMHQPLTNAKPINLALKARVIDALKGFNLRSIS